MKRIIIALSLLLTLATTNSFAAEVKVSASVINNFRARFADAENVIWSKADGFTIAQFTQDDKRQIAYFGTDGELTVVAEPISLNQLSKNRRANLQKQFSDYTITDVYKLEDNEGVKYYAVAETSDKKIIVSTTSSKWEVVKTSTK